MLDLDSFNEPGTSHTQYALGLDHHPVFLHGGYVLEGWVVQNLPSSGEECRDDYLWTPARALTTLPV